MDEEPKVDPRAFLKALKVLDLQNNSRCQELHARWAFYEGTQHDHQKFTWEGEKRDAGLKYMQARMKQHGYQPMDGITGSSKKPDTPLPLVRQIVSRFTEMLFGDGRRPQLVVPQDPATQDYLEAIFHEANLWEVLAQARDMAGACGSAAIANGVMDGIPFAEALHPGNLYVSEWDNAKPGWIPKVVIEQYQVLKDVLDPEDGKLKSEAYWRSRAWTDTEIIVYEDVRVRGWSKDETIPAAAGYPQEHSLGRCPVIWIQNTLNSKSPDGDPDCEGTWELLDQLDREQSIVHKAIRNNTAPTVVVKDAQAEFRRPREYIKGKLIEVGKDGDAKYLEMAGQSIEIGLKGIDALTMQVLRTVECIVLDPEQAKSYNSGESMQMLWRSMECRAGRLRVTAGGAVRETSDFWIKAGVMLDGKITLPPRRIKNENSDATKDTWGKHSCQSLLWVLVKLSAARTTRLSCLLLQPYDIMHGRSVLIRMSKLML